MKKIRWLLCVAGVALAAAIFSGCGSSVDVTLYEWDGMKQIVSVEKGGEFSLPVPVREGYAFLGWYDNEQFAGEAFTTAKGSKGAVFYARWEKQYLLTLDLCGGSLEGSGSYYLSPQENLSEFLREITPVKQGLTFGGWFRGEKEISVEDVMPAAELVLTAKYKASYTVETYLQTMDGSDYARGEDFVSCDFVGTNISAAPAIDGFENVVRQDTVSSLVLSEDAEKNVLKAYYDRKEITVTFVSNYPDGGPSECSYIDGRYGMEVEAGTIFSREGYILVGWSVSGEEGVQYATNYLEASACNGDGSACADTFVPDRDTVLYGVWLKGCVDLFGGRDHIYLDGDKAYLERGGIFFAGTYSEKNGEFIFRNSLTDNSVVLRGKLTREGIFVYRDYDRDGFSRKLFSVWEQKLDSDVCIYFDAYDGIDYVVKDENDRQSVSRGTLTIDENYIYTATFTEGELAGTTMCFFIGAIRNGEEIFSLYHPEEAALGRIGYCYWDGGDYVVRDDVGITLGGDGVALFGSEDSPSRAYYLYDGGTNTIRLRNGASEDVSLRLFERDGVTYFNFLNDALANTYRNGEESLTLDGVDGATYTDGGRTYVGRYNAVGSHLTYGNVDGSRFVVRFTSSDGAFTRSFLVCQEQTGEEVVYRFETRSSAYLETFYQDEEGTHTDLLLAIGESSQEDAAVYGLVNGEFIKLSRGTLQSRENGMIYTTTEFFPTEGAEELPFDFSKIASFEFVLGAAKEEYVNIWYGYTTTDGNAVTLGETEYSGADGLRVVLKAKYAFVYFRGGTYTGVYTSSEPTDEDTCNITVSFGSFTSMFELNTRTNTVVMLEYAPHTAFSADGMYYIELDGKGTGIYGAATGEGRTSEGAVVREGSTVFGDAIYRFVSNGARFRFIQVYDANRTIFYIYDDAHGTTYENGADMLVLDGFGYRAQYVDSADSFTGTYSFVEGEENLIELRLEEKTLYIDLVGENAFALRGSEYGTYLYYNNMKWESGIYVRLDGRGSAALFTANSLGNDKYDFEYIDENAVYVMDGDVCVVEYSTDGVGLIVKGQFRNIDISGRRYKAFFVEQKDVGLYYLNDGDWSILLLDSYNGATKYSANGVKTTGTYTLVSESLLVFRSSAEENSVYHYNRTTGVATMLELTAVAYYNRSLAPVQFFRDGTVNFNGDTGYYYDVVNGNAYLYHLAAEGEADANIYGYICEEFGAFDAEKSFNGEEYYLIRGYAIEFNLGENEEEEYPVILDGVAYYLKRVLFAPDTVGDFSVDGTAYLNDTIVACTVSRVGAHYYVDIGNRYRYEIFPTYGGETEQGRSKSSFSLASLAYYTYYSNYAYVGIVETIEQYGLAGIVSVKDEYGGIWLSQNIDKNGNPTGDKTLSADLIGDNRLFDSDGNELVIDRAAYAESDMGEDIFYVEFVAADGYVYRAYYRITESRYGSRECYYLVAWTREETVVSGDYSLTVETVLATQANMSVGSFLKVRLTCSEGDVSLENFRSFKQEIDEKNLLVYYFKTETENEKVVSVTAYKIALSYRDKKESDPYGGLLFEGAEIVRYEAAAVYDKEGKNYICLAEAGERRIVLYRSVEGEVVFSDGLFYDEEQGVVVEVGENSYLVTVHADDGEGEYIVCTLLEVPDESE